MNWQHFVDLLRGEMASGIVGSSLTRLMVAAILGGTHRPGARIEASRRRPAHQHVHLLWRGACSRCFSAGLAGVPSDAARIAAQIIPGIGFIGAGSILHTRGLTTGMTVGGHALRGRFRRNGRGRRTLRDRDLCHRLCSGCSFPARAHLEETFNLKLLISSYEVTGRQCRRDQQRSQPHSRSPSSPDAKRQQRRQYRPAHSSAV